jgi:hypothetical protein
MFYNRENKKNSLKKVNAFVSNYALLTIFQPFVKNFVKRNLPKIKGIKN